MDLGVEKLHTGAPQPTPTTPWVPLPTLYDKVFEATKLATGIEAHPWQVNTALAFLSGQDVFCLAGTGSGKTLAMVMPLFLVKNLILWLVSPLNYLANQQQERFESWGLPTIAVNSTTGSWSRIGKVSTSIFRKNEPLVIFSMQEIMKGKYRVIISSPESFLAANKLRTAVIALSLSADWQHYAATDEAHCVSTWADNFRKIYGLIGTIRKFITGLCPMGAFTATADRRIRQDIRVRLKLSRNNTYYQNLGCFRQNLCHNVHVLKSGLRSKGAAAELCAYFPSKPPANSVLRTTLIFVDSVNIGFTLLFALREWLGPAHAKKVSMYHATRPQLGKDLTTDQFLQEIGRIIICTEALTMVRFSRIVQLVLKCSHFLYSKGADFPHIELVIQFGITDLVTYQQRVGRGGRSPGLNCLGIMMITPKSTTKAAVIRAANNSKAPTVGSGVADQSQVMEAPLATQNEVQDPPDSHGQNSRGVGDESESDNEPDNARMVENPQIDSQGPANQQDFTNEQDIDEEILQEALQDAPEEPDDNLSSESEYASDDGVASRKSRQKKGKRRTRLIPLSAARYVELGICRNALLDEVFRNPPHVACRTIGGCDTCLALVERELAEQETSIRAPASPLQDAGNTGDPGEGPALKKRRTRQSARTDQECDVIVEALTTWRADTFELEGRELFVGLQAIMSDKTINALSTLR